MASDSRNRRIGSPPPWKFRLDAIKRLMEHHLPDQDNYYNSIWDDWEVRIKKGHKVEEKWINKRSKELADSGYDPGDILGEDYAKTWDLTNNMYAALIVSIWAEMENTLKSIVRACYAAHGKRKKALEKTLIFCKESLAGKKRKMPTLESCIKALKEIKAGVPYDFDGIKKTIKKETRIQLAKCRQYDTVDAIRILNNSFKHSNGKYKPEAGKPYTKINESLLQKWSIKEKEDIDYSKLPIEKIVVACNAFCTDLLKKVEIKLKGIK